MEQENHSGQEQLQLASASDFDSISLSGLLEGLRKSDSHAMEMVLNEQLHYANEAGDEAAQRALRVLARLCAFHLQVEDRGPSFVPRRYAPERRSYEPADFRGEQNDVLTGIISSIHHPALRARVADVVWFNDRRKLKAGVDAVSAYCEVAERRISGAFASALDGARDMIGDAVDFFHRAVQISASMGRGNKKELRHLVQETFSELYEHAKSHNHYVHFVRLAHLGASHDLIAWGVVASDAEAFASSAGNEVPPWALHPVWRLAVDAHEQLDDHDAKRRCVERTVEQTLRNREFVSHPGARAHWTRQAIEELRQGGGSRARIRELRVELREFQDEAIDATTQFGVPVDLSEEQTGTIKLFGDLSLPEALLRSGLIAYSPKVDDLRREAQKNLNAGGISSLLGSQYTDLEGKVIAETEAHSSGETPGDAQLKEQYSRILDMHRHIAVHGYIEPARRTVMTRFPLEERHFRPIVEASAFVPSGHKHLFCLGLARFWQGDFASAVHLLVPQIENSMRAVLLNSNEDSSKMSRNLTQEDRSLSGILESFRPEVDRVFGVDLANDIEMLFTHKPGPALRHELSHGKLYDGACYDANAIYACWLVYHLTVIPLAEHWGKWIAPAIEEIAF
jgi:hypothetical protein